MPVLARREGKVPGDKVHMARSSTRHELPMAATTSHHRAVPSAPQPKERGTTRQREGGDFGDLDQAPRCDAPTHKARQVHSTRYIRFFGPSPATPQAVHDLQQPHRAPIVRLPSLSHHGERLMKQRNPAGIVISAAVAVVPIATCRQAVRLISSARRAPTSTSSTSRHQRSQPRAFLDSAVSAGSQHSSATDTLSRPGLPRPLRQRCCARRPFSRTDIQRLQSSTVFSPTLLALIFAIALASWTAAHIAPTAASTDSPTPPIGTEPSPGISSIMSIDGIPQGHLGNLTPEQEQKLRQLWNAFFKVCGIADATDSSSGSTAPRSPAKAPSVQEPESSQKKRFGLFRWGGSDSTESGSGSKDATPDDNDKYEQTKDYHKTLKSTSPESIRQTIWSMVKHDHPDALLLRFLRARKWDVEKALVMLVSAMNWRHNQMKLDEDIMKNGEAGASEDEKNGSASTKKSGGDFMSQLRMGKSFLHGTDKQGRPICVVRVRLHKPGEQSLESLERYTVFIIETARLVLEPPVDTATIIFDMSNFTLANMDYQPVKFMVQCFEANYPESLGAVLVHNAPWVFQGIWKIIRGWLDPVVAAKVHFTNYRAGLEEFIAPSQIIKELDGDEDWQYEYEEPAEGENEAMKDTETRDQLLKARADLYSEFEAATRAWIRTPDSDQGKQAKAEREQVAQKLHSGYWNLDPYVRARSLYDRRGDILPNGKVNWYNKSENGSGSQASNIEAQVKEPSA